MADQLIATLKRLGEELNRTTDSLNYGGCGAYAAIVGRSLEQRGIPVRIRIGSPRKSTTYEVEDIKDCFDGAFVEYFKRVDGFILCMEYDLDLGHVIIEFDYKGRTYHADSNGVTIAREYTETYGFRLYQGSVSVLQMLQLALSESNRGVWNSSFRRSQLGHIIKHTRRLLSC